MEQQKIDKDDIAFIYFTDDSYKRVIKFGMRNMHKVKGGGVWVGDPKVMAPSSTVNECVRIYNVHAKNKVKTFDSPKEAQIKLYNIGYKKAVFMEKTDMKNIYQTKKVDIAKPDNHCKTVRGRDPWDTDWLIERTDKNPLSQNIKNRLTNYVDVNKGEPTIANILKFTELDINDIKYDIKLGYIKAYKVVDGKKKYK
tara:strand:- start:337 stop:927 length:591 start_codon:yes stop_codon:yes gene_type:complete